MVGDKVMIKKNNETLKKCKNYNLKLKILIRNANFSNNNCDNSKIDIRLFAWIKTLLYVHNAIPNIIKLIDKMVSIKASSPYSGSYIFGDYKNGTYGQVQEILNIENRKLSLINLYSMIDELTKHVPEKYKAFLEMKFFKRKKISYVAEELEITERTAFRWVNSILEILYNYCLVNNWSVSFFESQVAREPWILDHYNRFYSKLTKTKSK